MALCDWIKIHKEKWIKVKKIFANTSNLTNLVNVSALLTFIGLIEAWILTYYYKVNFNEWIGWQAADYAADSSKAIGVHFFSDYLAMIDLNNSVGDTRFSHPYPPFAILVFKIFSFLPYKLGLFFWLFLLLCLMFFPVLKALQSLQINSKLVYTIVLIGISYPLIATMDRANIIGLIPFLLFCSYLQYSKGNFNLAAVWLAIAINIKIYPILILLMLANRKNLQFVIKTSINSALIFFASAVVWAPNDPIRSMKSAFLNASKYQDVYTDGHGMNVSASQIVFNFLKRSGFTNDKFTNLYQENFKLVGILFLLILIVGAILSYEHEKWLFGLYAMQLVPSISWGYTRVWVITAFAILILRLSSTANPTQVVGRDLVWWIILILNSTVLTIFNMWPINLLPSIALILVLCLVVSKLFERIKPVVKGKPNS